MKNDQPSTLSYDYVFNYVFKKLSDTFDHYRNLLPPVSDIEQAITASQQDDPFHATIHILSILKKNADHSPLAAELFENVRRDFWHGVDPVKVQRHTGTYYIESVADTEK